MEEGRSKIVQKLRDVIYGVLLYRELVFVGNGVDVAVVDVAQLVGEFGDLVKMGGK